MPLAVRPSGGCSRAIAAIVSCPITVVKTRMEFGSVQGSSTLGMLRSITRTEGVRGLFGGLGPTVLSNAPFAGLYYMLYTRLQVGARKLGRHGLGVRVLRVVDDVAGAFRLRRRPYAKTARSQAPGLPRATAGIAVWAPRGPGLTPEPIPSPFPCSLG